MNPTLRGLPLADLRRKLMPIAHGSRRQKKSAVNAYLNSRVKQSLSFNAFEEAVIEASINEVGTIPDYPNLLATKSAISTYKCEMTFGTPAVAAAICDVLRRLNDDPNHPELVGYRIREHHQAVAYHTLEHSGADSSVVVLPANKRNERKTLIAITRRHRRVPVA